MNLKFAVKAVVVTDIITLKEWQETWQELKRSPDM